MHETIRRMQNGNPDDFIVTKEEDGVLFHQLRIIAILSLSLIVIVAIIACIFPMENLPAIRIISAYGIDAFSAVKRNYIYFESVNPGLGVSYSASFVIFLLIIVSSTGIVIILSAISQKSGWKRLKAHHLRSGVICLLFIVPILFILFYFDFTPDSVRAARSTMQGIFSTEWVIFVTSVLFGFIFLSIYTLPIAAMKLIRFRGEVAD